MQLPCPSHSHHIWWLEACCDHNILAQVFHSPSFFIFPKVSSWIRNYIHGTSILDCRSEPSCLQCVVEILPNSPQTHLNAAFPLHLSPPLDQDINLLWSRVCPIKDWEVCCNSVFSAFNHNPHICCSFRSLLINDQLWLLPWFDPLLGFYPLRIKQNLHSAM